MYAPHLVLPSLPQTPTYSDGLQVVWNSSPKGVCHTLALLLLILYLNKTVMVSEPRFLILSNLRIGHAALSTRQSHHEATGKEPTLKPQQES